MASDEALDSIHGLDDLLVRGRIADPHVTGAGRPEGGARHDADPLLLEQRLRELRLVEAGGVRDAREAVEGSLRLEGIEADLVEAIRDEPPAAVVLLVHLVQGRLT